MSDGQPPQRSIGFLMHDISRLMRRNFTRRTRELGLTQGQWQALKYLSWREGTNQAALADLMDIQPITLARLIDRLQEAGLVERRPDPSDRRSVRLHLTDAASPLLDELSRRANETKADLLDGIPQETQDQVIDALETMRSNLIARDAEARSACPAASETEEASEA